MRSMRLAAAALAATMGHASGFAQTIDPELPRDLAATCANCHGTGGDSVGGFASLAGMREDELVAMLRAYKAGTRPGTLMPQLAKGYTDAQIALLAGWFAAQKPAR